MKNQKLRLGLSLFFLGMLGVLSLLTMEVTYPEEVKAILDKRFSPVQLKLLTLLNPAIYLLIAVVVGVNLHKKVDLQVPVLEGLFTRREIKSIGSILQYGLAGGVLAGIAITIVGLVYEPWLPREFIAAGEKMEPGLAMRFLYGGITEEILMRFGLMTLMVWLLWKLTKKLTPSVYWTGITIAALLFGLGHFPVVYQVVASPDAILLSYILIGNTAGGLVFGWLYWKKGLESAMVAHIFAHVVMVLAGLLEKQFLS
ncbi:CPBP family intramembrane metalloprotease [Adhaeribacter sp. BT258]|uniref:CPBP family intramembrane metalloprotease n=1 Tax=Adhaeribacter terrigena TaxID=2793070 RepID=A0ABS1C3G6_9BACT|nr:CPBP family intramembrane glutamic endopeptidase [Adhaeribacter terrigena]MBK0403173.1 CPBP family intramembrane metalloprotease [Adhaeribacter terrigena]